MESEIKEYTPEIEALFIQFMMSNKELFVRSACILKEEYFDNKQNRDVVKLLITHAEQYTTMPSVEQVKAITGKELELIPEIAAKEDKWFFQEIELFCRYKSMRDAILASPDLLEQGRYGETLASIKAAVEIALIKDLGTDYYANPKGRLEAIRDGKGQISTGWKAVDEKLYGGFDCGSINIFAGQCVVANTKVVAIRGIELNELRNAFYDTKKHNMEQYRDALNSVYGDESEEFLKFVYGKIKPNEYNILDLHNKEEVWFVSTPDGFVPVISLISKGIEDILNITFTDGTDINVSPFHCFEMTDSTWISAINLNPGDKLKSENGFKTVLGITDIHQKDLVFDLVIESKNHRYYTNGVSSHNSGAGKSLFLQNLAVNWAQAGMNVVYLSLELSEKLCSMRLDAMHTGYETREVMKNIDNVHMKVRASQQKSHGTLRVKQMPNGCTSNDIRAYIKEYEIQTGIKVNAILVDYLDLMMPMSKKISAENLFVKDKYVTEELRNLMVELDVVGVSASQLNRGSYDLVEFDASSIAGGLSKVNTADNVIGIFTSAAMREGGRYQVQFMKTRSSSGVGSRVDLAFNNKSLRITDLEEDDDSAITATSKTIFQQLKNKSTTTTKPAEKINSETGEITSNSSKVDPLEGAAALRSFLKRK